ncbi:MAG TPA: hypothetical protein VFS92_08870, partial [Planctomycetota bacterium]|nr:hypothetical protein [Planctomycetota bacterium]
MRLSMILGAAAALVAGPVLAGDGEKPARMDPDAGLLKAGESRTFTITYKAIVKDVPADAKRLRIWVPVPQDTPLQKIEGLSFQGPVEPKVTT